MHPAPFPGQNAPPAWLCRWAEQLSGSLCGHRRCQSAKACVLVVMSPSPLLCRSVWARQTALPSPCCKGQSGGPYRVTYSAGGGRWQFPTGSFCPLEEQETQGQPLCVVVSWPGGGAVQSARSSFSYLSNAMRLCLYGTGECFSLTPMF